MVLYVFTIPSLTLISDHPFFLTAPSTVMSLGPAISLRSRRLPNNSTVPRSVPLLLLPQLPHERATELYRSAWVAQASALSSVPSSLPSCKRSGRSGPNWVTVLTHLSLTPFTSPGLCLDDNTILSIFFIPFIMVDVDLFFGGFLLLLAYPLLNELMHYTLVDVEQHKYSLRPQHLEPPQ